MIRQRGYASTVRVSVALLLHELPDGSEHVDLLVALTDAYVDDEDRVVPTWRAPNRPDCLELGATMTLEEIGHHRARYLRLTETCSLTDNRGRVTPLAIGTADSSESSAGRRLAVRWNDGRTSAWTLVNTQPGRWNLTNG